MDSISHGQMPFAPKGYKFYRNLHDFGATGDRSTDNTEAINRAVALHSTTDSTLQCSKGCRSTTMLGTLAYFLSSTYVVSTPIVQYYDTQFVGDANSRPTIKGMFNFTGMERHRRVYSRGQRQRQQVVH